MTKATRLIRTVQVTRATRATVLKEATLVTEKATIAANRLRWHRHFQALRARMAKRKGLQRMPRSIWRRR